MLVFENCLSRSSLEVLEKQKTNFKRRQTHYFISTNRRCCCLESNFLEVSSVTRLGDLLGFGQIFKAFGNN